MVRRRSNRGVKSYCTVIKNNGNHAVQVRTCLVQLYWHPVRTGTYLLVMLAETAMLKSSLFSIKIQMKLRGFRFWTPILSFAGLFIFAGLFVFAGLFRFDGIYTTSYQFSTESVRFAGLFAVFAGSSRFAPLKTENPVTSVLVHGTRYHYAAQYDHQPTDTQVHVLVLVPGTHNYSTLFSLRSK